MLVVTSCGSSSCLQLIVEIPREKTCWRWSQVISNVILGSSVINHKHRVWVYGCYSVNTSNKLPMKNLHCNARAEVILLSFFSLILYISYISLLSLVFGLSYFSPFLLHLFIFYFYVYFFFIASNPFILLLCLFRFFFFCSTFVISIFIFFVLLKIIAWNNVKLTSSN